jgi:hypothetical protein
MLPLSVLFPLRGGMRLPFSRLFPTFFVSCWKEKGKWGEKKLHNCDGLVKSQKTLTRAHRVHREIFIENKKLTLCLWERINSFCEIINCENGIFCRK